MLRHAGGSLPFEKLREGVLELRPATTSERVRHIVNRRGGSWVDVTPDGFSLIRPEKAPFISGKLLWGPSSAFTLFEVAIFRRRAILHILQSTPGGLTKKEVAAELRACSWIVAAVSIDTLREDFDFLEHSTQIRPDGQRWLTTDPL